MTKQEAREQAKLLRGAMTDRERQEKDRRVRKNLLLLDEVKQAEAFFLFASYGTEVDTICLIQKFLDEGRMVALPRVQGKEMAFYQIQDFCQLKPGYQGILEPVSEREVPAVEGVMLLPGLAFDKQKHRVGYGGGFYDRYLEKYPGTGLFKIALAYDFQIVDCLSVEDFDICPDIIVTDQRII